MSRILLVDDELSLREMLQIFFTKAGHAVTTASDGRGAVGCLRDGSYDLVLTDLKMAGPSGLDVLRASRELQPDTPVILMTAYASAETAIEAMKAGAYDYFTKPFNLDEVSVVIDKALERRRLVLQNQQLRQQLDSRGLCGLIGQSAAMRRTFDLIRRVAKTPTNVLILGESGTGKELVARAIHELSDRVKQPFMVVNCAAIPENLLESELFGHKRGAFTGAHTEKIGIFTAAHGGTLMLDEIGELPIMMQVKLLRVLQERNVKPVGGVHEHTVDVRVIAATNRDLEQMIDDCTFREDLYYRLNVISVELPPLRERAEDIPLLAYHFLRHYARSLGKAVYDIDPEVMQRILRHPFSGNVRELQNIIERAVTLEEGESITLDSLPPNLQFGTQAHTTLGIEIELPEAGVELESAVADIETKLIRQALDRTAGHKKDAARLLGISFRSLRYRLDKLRIE